jgi:hypothetical protein
LAASRPVAGGPDGGNRGLESPLVDAALANQHDKQVDGAGHLARYSTRVSTSLDRQQTGAAYLSRLGLIFVRSVTGLDTRPHQLAQTLAEHNLVDEYRLMIDPLIVGGGKRLFRNGNAPKRLRLVESKATSTGAILARYTTSEG